MEKEGIRYYIRTRTLLGLNPTEIHEELETAYGHPVTSYSTCQKWSLNVRNGSMEIEDKPIPGRPVSEVTQENIDFVRRVIDEDSHSTYTELEAKTEISRGSLETIIHKHLKLRKVTSRWVPHDLTPYQKQERVRICRDNLAKFQNESWRRCDIVTGDETWVYHRKIKKKAENAAWIGPGEKPKTTTKRGRFEAKTLFSIFFRASGPLWVHAVEADDGIDADYYIKNCLKPIIHEIHLQRLDTGTKGIKLLYDNARAHTASEVKNFLKDESLAVMPHPPYSPDLSPCDFWLFGYLKEHLPENVNKDTH